MAKVKIIDSYLLKCLKDSILSKLEEANNQITVCERELVNELQHKQDNETVVRLRESELRWLIRHEVLHQCLSKIQHYTKEVEI